MRPALPLRKNPEENRFCLTDSFRNGFIDEWHLVIPNPFLHLTFHLRSWFPQKGIVFWSSFPEARLKPIWSIGNAVRGDGIKH
jgi:hypothetical protein